MASITIRNLQDDIKQRLRVRAAEHGHSMEEEARVILSQAFSKDRPQQDLASAIRERVRASGGADLHFDTREPMREPPSFD